MNCRKARDLLVDYMEGLLPTRRKKGVQQHLALCESCRTEHERMQHLHRSLQSLSVPAPDATDWERFQRRLNEQLAQSSLAPQRARSIKPALKLLIPAAAMVSLVIVLFLFSGKLPWGAPDRVSVSGTGAGQEVSQPAAQHNGSSTTAEFLVALANLPGAELDQLEDEATFLMDDEAGMGLPGAVVSEMFTDGAFEEVEELTLEEYDELIEGLGSI